MDSGDGSRTLVGAMTDDEYLKEPVPDCWSARRRTDSRLVRTGRLPEP
ncbi:hypothetical protein [Streptomyces canus]